MRPISLPVTKKSSSTSDIKGSNSRPRICFARKWVLSGAAIREAALKSSGFVTETYHSENRTEIVQKLLSDIAKSAPVQRIQAKLALFETLRPQCETGIVMDKKVAKASMVSEDWKNIKKEESGFNFMPAKSMSYAVKLSLIKSEDSPNLEH